MVDNNDNFDNSVITSLYADDTIISCVVNNLNNCLCLQEHLKKNCYLGEKVGVKFNLTNCKFIRFSRNRNVVKYDYNINGIPLENVDNFLDLGILVSYDMSFNTHINNIVKKARGRLGLGKDALVLM